MNCAGHHWRTKDSIDGRAFSALDAISRKQLQALTKDLHKEFGMTTIFVTHDTDEALKLGDRIAVLQEGEIVQVWRILRPF